MDDCMQSYNENAVASSSKVLLSPELLENIFMQMRDSVIGVERVCQTWRNAIHNSCRIGQYRAYQPSIEYLPSGTGDLDADFEFPRIYYNIQSLVFPEDIWNLSSLMQLKFMPEKHLTFELKRPPTYIGVSSGHKMLARQFQFDLSNSSCSSPPSSTKGMNTTPSWHNVQLSYPATKTQRFRMADIVHRNELIRAEASDLLELYPQSQIKNALQFEITCESGITYGHLVDAFTRNYERKGILSIAFQNFAWNLRLPTDSDDCTRFIYEVSDRSSFTNSETSDRAAQGPTIHESELVRRIVQKHKRSGWGLVNIAAAMERGRSMLRETRRPCT